MKAQLKYPIFIFAKGDNMIYVFWEEKERKRTIYDWWEKIDIKRRYV